MRLLLIALLFAASACTLPTRKYPAHVVRAFNTIPVTYRDSLTPDVKELADLYLDEVIEFTLRGVSPFELEEVKDVPARVKLVLLEHLLWNTKAEFDIVLVEVGPRYAGDWYVSQVTGEVNRYTAVDVRATAYRTNHKRAADDGLKVWFNLAERPDP